MKIWEEDFIVRCATDRHIIKKDDSVYYERKIYADEISSCETIMHHDGCFTFLLPKNYLLNSLGRLELKYNVFNNRLVGFSLVNEESEESSDNSFVISKTQRINYWGMAIELSSEELKFLLMHIGRWLARTIKIDDVICNLNNA